MTWYRWAIGYTASFILLGDVFDMGSLPAGAAYAIWDAGGVALTALSAHLRAVPMPASRKLSRTSRTAQ